ncbi:MAG: DNA-directed RNA polymerase subunit beta', partial [Candidatus Omnitrophota bacterium]|nr:DNA-directed RNA polymerase subunit beta' [Candidatus Omnitrophota bacterium]
IKSAKKMVEKVKSEVWDILEEVVKEHPILLNRAPTLHRLGIQAFEPVLVEGKAIRVHPLVCAAFNADFDGDQMAVHVPLSIEAQMEARILMLAPNNIFSPANGEPIDSPTQDIVLGCYYLTKEKPGDLGEGRIFSSTDEVITACLDKEVNIHARVKVRINNEIIDTTVGRVCFNEVLPEGFPFFNDTINKKKLSHIVVDCHNRFGHHQVISTLDKLKEIGFEESTLAGISISIDSLQIPARKREYLTEANQEVSAVERQYHQGLITDRERYNKVVDIWTRISDRVSEQIFETLDPFNPIFMMADSGARGSKLQIRQLCGMRGLMAKPSGEIIESPITANFREGLTVLEYFISTHGARKGLADTALKTADSGYLTRRLVDVAQDVIIREVDCGTLNGITVEAIIEGDEVVVSLKERIIGRIALDNVVDIITDEVIVRAGEDITKEMAAKIETASIEKIRIRSVLTCEASSGVCAKCYGRDLASGKLAEIGEAVGIIAAQSIGEPGTQLTMRTFHIGGTASRIIEQSFVKARNKGILKYHNLKIVESGLKEMVILNRNGQVSIHDNNGRELERHTIPIGSKMLIEEGKAVKKGEIFVRWEPYTIPILTEVKGKVRFEDIIKDVSIKEELDAATDLIKRVIIDHKEDMHPQIVIYGPKKEILSFYPMPVGVHIVVKDGQEVKAGDLLAKTPRKFIKTKDITGGLPRVAELFEARRPRNPAVISEIDGVVEFGEAAKGQRKIIVTSSTGMKKEYVVPYDSHLNVYKGDRVIAGEQLIEGPIVPHDILRVCGDKRLQEYLVREIQEVYRLQGVKINDKHIEVIVRQMLRKVRIEDAGDTKFLLGASVDKFKFRKENEEMVKKNKRPARATPLLLGITKASLGTESFISAASFQETTRILTDAAARSRKDELLGLKENVIMGHLIPAGTGYRSHREIEIVKNVPEDKNKSKISVKESESQSAKESKSQSAKESKSQSAKESKSQSAKESKSQSAKESKSKL